MAKIEESKQFTLNWRDIRKTFVSAFVGSIIGSATLWLNSGSFDWRGALGGAIIAGLTEAYKRFTDKNKVIVIPNAYESLESTKQKVKQAV